MWLVKIDSQSKDEHTYIVFVPNAQSASEEWEKVPGHPGLYRKAKDNKKGYNDEKRP